MMMINLRILLFTLLITSSTLVAKGKTFNYLHINQMPKSIEKDYYIWRFLTQKTTTKAEARKIIYQVSRLNKKLRTAYRKKTGMNPKLPKIKATGPVDESWRKRSKANKSFKHGLALMKQKKPQQAIHYFKDARENYKKRYDKDKSLFWLYLSTKDESYIKLLRESCDVNIYTLMAADTTNATYPKTITESIWWDSAKPGFNIKDPIHWAKVKEKMKSDVDLDDLADDHKSQEAIGVYTYIKAKACNYEDQYFPMPYRDVLKKMTPERQALIYAIARQESRFVPASVSRSFALGMMQFMPFLIEHVAKEKGHSIDFDDIFDPYLAIEYADFHLDYLTKYLYHPLFIAYAYNAGIGFTKRHLQKKGNFRHGPYEPYMSMESMKNYEAKEYGKKVLANYIIYLNKLGVNTRIFPLIKVLATPSVTDKFRS